MKWVRTAITIFILQMKVRYRKLNVLTMSHNYKVAELELV